VVIERAINKRLAGGRSAMLRVRLAKAALVPDLAAHFEKHGFLVSRRGRGELELTPLNPVSARYDRTRAEAVLGGWSALQAERLQGSPAELL
jgi:hypothetical protein